MNQPEQSILTITLSGELAEWLEQEADTKIRTPSQQAAYLLGNFMAAANRRKQETLERTAKRKALGLGNSRKAA